MKTLVLTTNELDILGLLGANATKKMRIISIDRTPGNGVLVETREKTLSVSGVFHLEKQNADSAIANVCGFHGYQPVDSEINYFIKAVNTTADFSKSLLEVTFHHTLLGFPFNASAELVALFPHLELGEEVELNEGWKDISNLHRIAFEEPIIIGSFSFIISEDAEEKYQQYKQGVLELEGKHLILEMDIPKDIDPFKDMFGGTPKPKVKSQILPKVIQNEAAKSLNASKPSVTAATYDKNLNSDDRLSVTLIFWGFIILFLFTVSSLVTRSRDGCKCWDGTVSYADGRGACSDHGGVMYWTYKYWWEK